MEASYKTTLELDEPVGGYVLRNYEASFSRNNWNYSPEDPRSTDSPSCICCAYARDRLITHDYSSKDLFWLVDVATLKKVVTIGVKDLGKRCRFCSIIYQAFWSLQDGSYRLRSQLWTRNVGPNEPDDWELEIPNMPPTWSVVDRTLQRSGVAKHFDTKWYDTPGCGSCVLCRQDSYAELAITGTEQLCAVCAHENLHFGQAGIARTEEVRPPIPLLLSLRISAAGVGLSTLQVRHAGGATIRDIRAANAEASFYEFKMYTHSSLFNGPQSRLRP